VATFNLCYSYQVCICAFGKGLAVYVGFLTCFQCYMVSMQVVSQYSSLLAPMAVDAVLNVIDPARPNSVDLKDIKVLKKLGGTVDDTEMINGLVFDNKASHLAGGPTRIENAKIGLIQFQISPPKTDIEQNVIVSDYTQMDRILKEERNYILGIIKKIRVTGCNVLLIQKSILRDAVTDLSLHYLAKAKILVVKDVEREDIEFISKTLNCLPIANIEHFRTEKLGRADLVEEVSVGSGRVSFFFLILSIDASRSNNSGSRFVHDKYLFAFLHMEENSTLNLVESPYKICEDLSTWDNTR
jgi:chaperonin GroEL (HSP60 family)